MTRCRSLLVLTFRFEYKHDHDDASLFATAHMSHNIEPLTRSVPIGYSYPDTLGGIVLRACGRTADSCSGRPNLAELHV